MRPRAQGFIPASDSHDFRLALSLDFVAPVSREQARQVARRLLESLRIEAQPAAGAVSDPDLRACRLTCHDLRQVIKLLPPATRSDDGAD